MSLSPSSVEAYYRECREDRLSLLAFYYSLLTFDKVHGFSADFCKTNRLQNVENRDLFFRVYFESRVLDLGSRESLLCSVKIQEEFPLVAHPDQAGISAKKRSALLMEIDQNIWEQRNRCMATKSFYPYFVECKPCSEDDGGEDDFVVRAIHGMENGYAKYFVYFHRIIMDAVKEGWRF